MKLGVPALRRFEVMKLVPLAGYCFLYLALFWWGVRPFPIFASSKILIGIFLVIAIVWLVVANRSRRSEVLVAWLLMTGLLLGTVSSAAWRTSLEAALVPAVAIALFLLVAGVGLRRRWLTIALVAAASTLGLMTIVGFVREVGYWYTVMSDVAPSSSFLERIPVTLPRVGLGALHPNETAVIGAVSLPLAIVGWRWFSDFRMFWGLAIALLSGMVVVTGSRGGVIGAAVAVLVTLWMLRGRGPLSRKRWRVAGMLVALLGMTAVTALVLTDYRPDFIFRGTVGDRLPLWSAGWEMFLDSPIVGNGAGSFSWLVDEYLGSTYPGVLARRVWNEAHNGYIQLLAEFGISGVVAIGAGFWIAIRRALSGIREIRLDKTYGVAVIAATLGVAIHSIFDDFTASLAPMIFIAVLFGGLFTETDHSRGRPSSRPRIWASVLVAAPLTFLVFTIPAQVEYERGAAAAWQDDWAEALVHFENASMRDPHPVYERSVVVASSILGDGQVEAFESAAALSPFESGAFLNFVTFASPEQAIDLLMQEQTRLRAEEVVLITVGEMSDDLGRGPMAMREYRRVLTMNPWLIGADVWTRLLPNDGSVLSLYESVLLESPCDVADVFYLGGFDLAKYAEQVEGMCATGSPSEMAFRLANGEWESVVRSANLVLGGVPENVRARRMAAAALVSRNPEEAQRHLAVNALLGDSWSALALVNSYRGATPRSVQALATRNTSANSPVFSRSEGPSIYRMGGIRTRIVDRRWELPTILVPGLWEHAVTPLRSEIIKVLGD